MPQSYENRFKGHEDEIRNDLALLGESPTAEHWGATSGLAFHEYATKILGRPPEFSTKFALSDMAQLAHYLVTDLLARLQAQDAEIIRLRQELAKEHDQQLLNQRRLKMSGVDLMRFLDQAKG
jgi:uncharacterized small protein (DUF1192 family)